MDGNPKKQPSYVAYARFLITMLRGCHGNSRARFLSLRCRAESLAMQTSSEWQMLPMHIEHRLESPASIHHLLSNSVSVWCHICRSPINSLFQALPGLPPALQSEILAVLHRDVLDAAAGLPASVQAAAFSGSGLYQVYRAHFARVTTFQTASPALCVMLVHPASLGNRR